ncbi:hypothetical protein QWJ34_16660 [Saccharibacillus sp. CPCC 101409]|uniref:hypothetical protein n=1 Tax=Saccharibacillus sp. CPCC 101409 TaxID=3058041 RepID=UPI00267290D5|nr:hypothetical protein [Saccharibacillus sp. CPCC 101409]MDO3411400.1 hypothetical protein [Saccharibacillus sp. CPCC 101409]
METYIWAAAAAFAIWIYEQTRKALSRRAQHREHRLRFALEAYGSAVALAEEKLAAERKPAAELDSRLRGGLHICQGIQGFTPELDGHIALYLDGGEQDRLPQLHDALHRELERTRHELGELLEREERPSWGGGFLRLLKPALAPALLGGAAAAGMQFAREPELDGSPLLPLCRLLSWLLAALLAARLLEPGYRAERPALRRLLPLAAAAPALLNPALGAEAAPWLLGAQLALAALGFAALRPAAAKRRERPYAGRSPQLRPASAQPEGLPARGSRAEGTAAPTPDGAHEQAAPQPRSRAARSEAPAQSGTASAAETRGGEAGPAEQETALSPRRA